MTDCSAAYYILPLVLMGIFYSFYAAVLWPCIPIICIPQIVGTGFGICTAIQNFGTFFSVFINGAYAFFAFFVGN